MVDIQILSDMVLRSLKKVGFLCVVALVFVVTIYRLLIGVDLRGLIVPFHLVIGISKY